jgi:Flp pilus assembly protein TadD
MSEFPVPPASDPTHALTALQDAARREPGNGAVQMELGKHYLSTGLGLEAEQAFRRAGRLLRGFPQPRLGVAASLLLQGKREDARNELRKSLQEFPNNADAWFNLGNLNRNELQLDEAARCYRKVLAIRGSDESACLNLAVVLTKRDRFEEAERALTDFIESQGPTADSLNNLGQVLRYQRKFQSAENAYRDALQLEAQHPGARLNLAVTLNQAGDGHTAERMLREIIAASADNSEARLQLATVLLLDGRFEEGWKEYAWRDTYSSSKYGASQVPALEDLLGRRVIVKGEQGLGDVLFFLRFLPALSAVAGTVFVDTDPRLTKVLRGAVRVADASRGESIEIMAGDLPAITRTALAAPVPLIADPALASELAKQLSEFGPPPYLGITWEAGTRLRDSKKPGAELHKRIEPQVLARAFDGVEGTLVCLQRKPTDADMTEFRLALKDRALNDLSAVNLDLEKALALLSLLDAYVGVSNTNMHLLAGIGKEGEVLVPVPPDWRWMRNGGGSPWFPGFRVYRQGADLSWEPAIEALRTRLRNQPDKYK